MEPAHPSPTISTPLLDAIRTFLEGPRYATIATISADGAPHAAVVWYALDGDDLIINSRRERHWPRNLARDPRIAVAVPDIDIPDHWVGVKGNALFLRDGDAALADIQALARRYGGDPDTYVGQDRVTYRIVVESTFEYGA
jgi:PPOX class probable F420-dependent enzyme